jgi:hypothetical protein
MSNIKRRKEVKDLNAGIVKMMMYGNPEVPYTCLVEGTSKILEVINENHITGELEERIWFQIDHTRELPGGGSMDKFGTPISDKLRSCILSAGTESAILAILEIMCCRILSMEAHHDKTSDVQRSKVSFTIADVTPDTYPWFLKSSKNFYRFCKYVNLENLNYKIFMKHLHDASAPPINECEWVKDILPVIANLTKSQAIYIGKQYREGIIESDKEFKEYYARKYNTTEYTITTIIKDKKRNPKTMELRQKKTDQRYMKKYVSLQRNRKATITMTDFDKRNNKYVGFTSKINRRLLATA